MVSPDPNAEKAVVPEEEILDFELPPEPSNSRHVEDNVANLNTSSLRSFFIGMGFLSSLVDKVIEEKGEENVDLILDTLIAYSGLQKSNSESSDSIERLFDDNESNSPEISTPTIGQPNEDLRKSNSESSDSLDRLFDDIDKEASRLEIPTPTIAQQKEDLQNSNDESSDSLESLFDDKEASSPEKAVQPKEDLQKSNSESSDSLDRLFDDREASSLEIFSIPTAVRQREDLHKSNFGSSDSLDSLFDDKEASCPEISTPRVVQPKEDNVASLTRSNIRSFLIGMGFLPSLVDKVIKEEGEENADLLLDTLVEYSNSSHADDTVDVKAEDFIFDAVSYSRNINVEQTFKGKRPNQEHSDNCLDAFPQSRHINFGENSKGKRPKQEDIDHLDPNSN